MNTVVLFIILSVANVITSTVKSIATIKSGKYVASLINALYYGYYTFVCVLTVTLDFALWQKAFITFACNLIGVFTVKLIEEKMRKDRLWKIELTIKPIYKDTMTKMLDELSIPYNYVDINKYFVFNVYSSTQEQSILVKAIASECNAKYFVAESKIL